MDTESTFPNSLKLAQMQGFLAPAAVSADLREQKNGQQDAARQAAGGRAVQIND